MNTTGLLNPGWWIKRAFRVFVAILGLLLLPSLLSHTPFGPLLLLGAICYIAYRIWASQTANRRPPQRNARGAERTPVLPGGEFHQ